MNIVILSLFTVYYTESNLNCSYEQLNNIFGPWDTNLRYYMIPSMRQGYGQNIIDEVNRIFKHKFTTIYVFGTPMIPLQKEWLRRCSSTMFPYGVLAWGSDSNFVNVPYSSIISYNKNYITDVLDGIYDENPLSKMVMFLPFTANLTL